MPLATNDFPSSVSTAWSAPLSEKVLATIGIVVASLVMVILLVRISITRNRRLKIRECPRQLSRSSSNVTFGNRGIISQQWSYIETRDNHDQPGRSSSQLSNSMYFDDSFTRPLSISIPENPLPELALARQGKQDRVDLLHPPYAARDLSFPELGGQSPSFSNRLKVRGGIESQSPASPSSFATLQSAPIGWWSKWLEKKESSEKGHGRLPADTAFSSFGKPSHTLQEVISSPISLIHIRQPVLHNERDGDTRRSRTTWSETRAPSIFHLSTSPIDVSQHNAGETLSARPPDASILASSNRGSMEVHRRCSFALIPEVVDDIAPGRHQSFMGEISRSFEHSRVPNQYLDSKPRKIEEMGVCREI